MPAIQSAGGSALWARPLLPKCGNIWRRNKPMRETAENVAKNQTASKEEIKAGMAQHGAAARKWRLK